MRIKTLPFLAVAACCLVPLSLSAEPTQPGQPTDTNAPAADPTYGQLQQMVLQVQTKAHDGKNTEADFAEELKTLDKLIASKKDAKTDEAVQMTYMKAMLYIEVIKNFDKAGQIMRQITNNYPNTEYSDSATKLLAKIDGMAAQKAPSSLVAGAPFPDFAVTNLTGGPLSVGALKGKVVLVDFWATWCPPCRAELPNVIETYKKHHADGFEIIGVSLDSDRDALDEFLKKQEGMTWPQYFDGQGWGNTLAQKYGVTGIPFTVLIGPDGKIIGTELRGEDLETAVTKAVAKK